MWRCLLGQPRAWRWLNWPENVTTPASPRTRIIYQYFRTKREKKRLFLRHLGLDRQKAVPVPITKSKSAPDQKKSQADGLDCSGTCTRTATPKRWQRSLATTQLNSTDPSLGPLPEIMTQRAGYQGSEEGKMANPSAQSSAKATQKHKITKPMNVSVRLIDLKTATTNTSCFYSCVGSTLIFLFFQIV